MAGAHHDLALVCRARGLDLAVDAPQPWLNRTGHLNPLVAAAAPAAVVDALATIFRMLGGDDRQLGRNRAGTPSAPDLVDRRTGCIVEIDELPHYTRARVRTLDHYPATAVLDYELEAYRALIERHHRAAEAVLARETTKDFPFPGGRQAQRAYGDALRDLLAPVFTPRPVVRIDVVERSLTAAADELVSRLTETGT